MDDVKTPILGITICHLTGSVEIVTILHRFGQYASYLYILELETAISNEIIASFYILVGTILFTRGNCNKKRNDLFNA